MSAKMSRPVLQLPRSGLENVCEGLALAGLLLSLVIFFYYWPQLPASIPTHFDIHGKVNEWGSKAVFVVFPGMSALMYGILLMVNKFPHTFNYPWPITEANAPAQYRLARMLLSWLKACCCWLMALLGLFTAQAALTPGHPGIPTAALLGTGLLIVFGLVVYFVRSWQAR